MNTFSVFYIDVTYDRFPEEEKEASKRYKSAIERELKIELSDIDIGAGASYPAFVTYIVDNFALIGGGALAVLFAGKPIRDGFQAWLATAQDIRRYLTRAAHLDRNAAAVLAIERVLETSGSDVTEISLVDYCIVSRRLGEVRDSNSDRIKTNEQNIDQIADGSHRFLITTNNEMFEVTVEGRDVNFCAVK